MRKREDRLVEEDALEPEADRHEEIDGDVEEAEKGKDSDEIGPLQEGHEGDEQEAKGAREEHEALIRPGAGRPRPGEARP